MSTNPPLLQDSATVKRASCLTGPLPLCTSLIILQGEHPALSTLQRKVSGLLHSDPQCTGIWLSPPSLPGTLKRQCEEKARPCFPPTCSLNQGNAEHTLSNPSLLHVSHFDLRVHMEREARYSMAEAVLYAGSGNLIASTISGYRSTILCMYIQKQVHLKSMELTPTGPHGWANQQWECKCWVASQQHFKHHGSMPGGKDIASANTDANAILLGSIIFRQRGCAYWSKEAVL